MKDYEKTLLLYAALPEDNLTDHADFAHKCAVEVRSLRNRLEQAEAACAEMVSSIHHAIPDHVWLALSERTKNECDFVEVPKTSAPALWRLIRSVASNPGQSLLKRLDAYEELAKYTGHIDCGCKDLKEVRNDCKYRNALAAVEAAKEKP